MTTMRFATFGGGCFWCLEALFERLPGVRAVTSGFAGGRTEAPTYEQVCGSDTGHAEVIHIEFDPAIIPYSRLLEVFWLAHDPTTPNRQGADVGSQYRSIILWHDAEQRTEAERSMAGANASRFGGRIVTEVKPFTRFYPADAHHQDFYRNQPGHPYCRAVILPKLAKVPAA